MNAKEVTEEIRNEKKKRTVYTVLCLDNNTFTKCFFKLMQAKKYLFSIIKKKKKLNYCFLLIKDLIDKEGYILKTEFLYSATPN